MKFILAISGNIVYNTEVPAGVMELVDVVDSKSTDGDIVPVRVRPPAPKKSAILGRGLPILLLHSSLWPIFGK